MLRPGNIAHKRLMQAIPSLAACILLFQSCNGTGSSGTYVRNLRSEVKRQFVQRNVDSALICPAGSWQQPIPPAFIRKQ